MNIFENIPKKLHDELFETILESENLKIEKIVSEGQISNEWYDQEENEWVILLQGNAHLEFEDKTVELQSGDYINIPAHVKHKVTYTSKNPKCVWLALFYS